MASLLSGHSSSMIMLDTLKVPVPDYMAPIIVQPGTSKANSAPDIYESPDLESLPLGLIQLLKHDVINLHSEWIAGKQHLNIFSLVSRRMERFLIF